MGYNSQEEFVYNGAIVSLTPTHIDCGEVTYTLTIHDSCFDNANSLSIDITECEMSKLENLIDDAEHMGRLWKEEVYDE